MPVSTISHSTATAAQQGLGGTRGSRSYPSGGGAAKGRAAPLLPPGHDQARAAFTSHATSACLPGFYEEGLSPPTNQTDHTPTMAFIGSSRRNQTGQRCTLRPGAQRPASGGSRGGIGHPAGHRGVARRLGVCRPGADEAVPAPPLEPGESPIARQAARAAVSG